MYHYGYEVNSQVVTLSRQNWILPDCFYVYKNEFISGAVRFLFLEGVDMEIVKIINNNVVSSMDAKGRETIVMGKGIGFGRKTGDEIPETSIEKVFHLPDDSKNQFENLISDIPYEHTRLAGDIIAYASEYLGKTLSKSVYITLTEHLSYAIERQSKDVVFQNALLWEIKRYYAKEFAVGMYALDLIKEQTGIQFSEDEAASLALHILNAEADGLNISDAMQMPGIIKDILSIVRYTMNLDINEKTIAYERFMTHLKFFIQRAVSKQYYAETDMLDMETFKDFIERCHKEHLAALRIKSYIASKMDYEVSDEEVLYLTMHIHRVIKPN
jgi:beta-glucoside operon transcriptional antiterminator